MFVYFYKWIWINGYLKNFMLGWLSLFYCIMNRYDVVLEYRKRYGFLYLRKDEEKFF